MPLTWVFSRVEVSTAHVLVGADNPLGDDRATSTGWWRLQPEANLVGRAGSAGDDLGSAVMTGQLVSDLMRLAFLMERRYAPYSKWFGTAFAQLACGPELAPVLRVALRADSWQGRETALMTAYEQLAAMHDALGVTAPVPTEVVRMWDRPFVVSWADFPGLLTAEIHDPEVLGVARRFPWGPVDRVRDLLWPPASRPALLRLLEGDERDGLVARPRR